MCKPFLSVLSDSLELGKLDYYKTVKDRNL